MQGVQFVTFVFMARVLTPTDYGLVSMLAFLIIFGHLLSDGGLSQAIIRKIDRTEKDCSTAFYVNVGIGVVLYFVLFFSAPLIADFYNEPQLVGILRVLAICVVIQSTLVVHRAILVAKLDFLTQAKSTIVGALVSGMVGLGMAYYGLGVWSIVGLQISNQIVTGATLWIVSGWHPRERFSRASFGTLYSFGSKMLASTLMDSAYQSLFPLIIGRVFSAYPLGCYTNARQIGSMASENVTNIVNRATFPHLCKSQNNLETLSEQVLRYMQLLSLLVCPLLFGIAALSTPLTLALIGSQWIYTGHLLAILCLGLLFYPLNSVNLMIPQITGNGAQFLRLRIANILVGLLFLGCSIFYGLSAVCVGIFAAEGICFIINSCTAGRAVGLGFKRQFLAVFPTFFCALIMGMVVFSIQHFMESDHWTKVWLGIAVGTIIYVGLSLLFQPQLCKSALSVIRTKKVNSNE